MNDSVDYYLEIGLFNKDEKRFYNKAIDYTEKAIEFAKKKKTTSKLAKCYLQLANIYYDLEKNDLAIDYYIRAINEYNKKIPLTNLALSYYGLGKCYLKKDNIRVAEIYFEKASLLYKKLNFIEAIELINLQKGIIQKEKKNYKEASKIIQSVVNNLVDDTFLSTKTEAFFSVGRNRNVTKRVRESHRIL